MKYCQTQYKNAYDSVNHDALERAMRAVGLYEADVRLARAMLANQSHRCVTAHGLTNRVSGWGPSGVAQGATESPLLFGIMLEPLLRELDMHCREHGFNIGSTTVCVQAYADDMVLISETEHGSSNIFNHRGLADGKDI